jgi:hypothetical protein
VDRGDEIGFENEYVSVALVPRASFDEHPWSLGGGGAAELKELLESRADEKSWGMSSRVSASPRFLVNTTSLIA